MIRPRMFARLGPARFPGRALALVLVTAIGLGILPFSVQQPLLAGEERSSRFEPIDVCNAGDGSLGLLADLPALVPAISAVLVDVGAGPAPPEAPVALRDGFAPGVYRPPRTSC